MYHSTSNTQKSPVTQARLEDCTGCRSNHPEPSDDVRNESDLLSKYRDSTIAAGVYLLPAGQVTCNA